MAHDASGRITGDIGMNVESRSEVVRPLPAGPAVPAQAGNGLGARARLPAHPILLLAALLTAAEAVIATLLPPAAAVALSERGQLVVVGLVLVALFQAWPEAPVDRRRVVVALTATMLLASAGMLLQDAAQDAAQSAVWVTVSTLLFLFAVGTFVSLTSVALSAGLGRLLLVTTWLDALIVFVAASVVTGVAWTVLVPGPASAATPVMLPALLVLGAWSTAAALVLLSMGMRPALGGPWAVLLGTLVVTVSAAAWLVLVTADDRPTTLLPTQFLLPAGVLLVAHGSLTWTLSPLGSGRLGWAANRIADVVPLAGVAIILLLDVLTIGRPLLLVQVGLVAAILLTGARLAILRWEGLRLEAAQRATEARLLVQTADRDTALRSMTRLGAGETLRETAGRIVTEALTLPRIDVAWLSTIADDGVARVLATAGLPAGVLMGRAAMPGPGATAVDVGTVTVWVERPSPEGNGHLVDLAMCGVVGTLVAPFRCEDRLAGYIALGTRSINAAQELPQRAATARELAVLSASLMGPTIAVEEQARRSRAEIDTLIREGAFHPVFQPIAELVTGRVVGYEALTRFADGRPPEVVFEVARVAGRGKELEVATLAAAIAEAELLDPACYLSINVSPDLAVAPDLLGPLLGRAGRELVLEITEHVRVADYERLIATLYALDLRIRIAVDDAGAGYAGLQHILAIRPQLVKLDISLVRSVDVDIARQALIGGMVSFTHRVGATLVAEGVERWAEADMLRSLGVDLMQGYLVGRPVRVADLGRLWVEREAGTDPGTAAEPVDVGGPVDVAVGEPAADAAPRATLALSRPGRSRRSVPSRPASGPTARS